MIEPEIVFVCPELSHNVMERDKPIEPCLHLGCPEDLVPYISISSLRAFLEKEQKNNEVVADFEDLDLEDDEYEQEMIFMIKEFFQRLQPDEEE